MRKKIGDLGKLLKQEKIIEEWLDNCPVDWNMFGELSITLSCEKLGVVEKEVIFYPTVRNSNGTPIKGFRKWAEYLTSNSLAV